MLWAKIVQIECRITKLAWVLCRDAAYLRGPNAKITKKESVAPIMPRFFIRGTLRHHVRHHGPPATLLSAFGLGRVRQYTPFGFSLSALHLDPSDTPLRLRQNMGFRHSLVRGMVRGVPYRPRPWQFLNFLPLPQGQGSLRPGSFSATMGWVRRCSRVSRAAACCWLGSVRSSREVT